LSGKVTTAILAALSFVKPSISNGLIEALSSQLVDTRDPLLVSFSQVSQLRTVILQRAINWAELNDTAVLDSDPLLMCL
jgi:hypothetical protein|tara:strand:- start:748 stop:984 length:237 start_codon:yes stop_codon:yes gene_type:complete